MRTRTLSRSRFLRAATVQDYALASALSPPVSRLPLAEVTFVGSAFGKYHVAVLIQERRCAALPGSSQLAHNALSVISNAQPVKLIARIRSAACVKKPLSAAFSRAGTIGVPIS